MEEFEFIATLVIVKKILGYTKGFTKKLQTIQLDQKVMTDDVKILLATLKECRDDIDCRFHGWYQFILELANEVNTTEKIKRRCSVMLYRENYESSCPKDYYKDAVAIPFLDHLRMEIQSRFPNESLQIYAAFHFFPRRVIECADYYVNEFCSTYKNDLPSFSTLYAQLDTWEVKWKAFTGTLPNTTKELLDATDKYLFPTIHEALRILATIPVTTCSCERSISCLRRLKTWMRNKMTEERLNSLSVIMFNRHVRVRTDNVDKFFANDRQRMGSGNILDS
ncbi:52 kDa repressor of the inhibitor of the protein kinase-like [Clytia hemisphaerica]|uniref:52 kDa repressor of the inhibitor of the protein kinase-like n=1 Tax=Clytia hemisphaerica TaxID=252671 RepID=UPI0034D40298